MLKHKYRIIFILVLIVGLGFICFRPYSSGFSGREENLDNEGTNYFVDGWCEHERGCVLGYSPCDVEVKYSGEFRQGTLIITVLDDEQNEVYKKTITTPGHYEDSVKFRCGGERYYIYFKYSEGSSGFFYCEDAQYVPYYRYLFNIGRR